VDSYPKSNHPILTHFWTFHYIWWVDISTCPQGCSTVIGRLTIEVIPNPWDWVTSFLVRVHPTPSASVHVTRLLLGLPRVGIHFLCKVHGTLDRVGSHEQLKFERNCISESSLEKRLSGELSWWLQACPQNIQIIVWWMYVCNPQLAPSLSGTSFILSIVCPELVLHCLPHSPPLSHWYLETDLSWHCRVLPECFDFEGVCHIWEQSCPLLVPLFMQYVDEACSELGSRSAPSPRKNLCGDVLGSGFQLGALLDYK